ncbi:MAG: trypsin-like peptidase domain-containing protein [Egibacteraceae bacterium]
MWVLRASGETAGAGFVVSDAGLIVTCAHVVGNEPARDVTVVFHGPGERRQARVAPA